jgi:flagellar basal-body rod modification protein FlgD
MTIDGLETTYDLSSLLSEETSSTANEQVLDRDDFLTLLLTQLQNQDPLDPLESAEFTAQLAQFSSLEQLFNANENLESIQEMIYNQGEEDLIQLIGKTVKADDNTILVEGETVLSSGSYSLEEGADVSVVMYDSSGNEVRTLYLGWQDEGEYTIDWDGLDTDGEMVDDGTYYFSVTAEDENGNEVEANTYIIGEVIGVTYQYGVPYLMIGDNLVSTDHTIVEVTETPAEE